MNDLLNEDEFLPKEHNTRWWFWQFFIYSFLGEVTILLIFKYVIHFSSETVSRLVGISNNFILPLAISMMMVFGKKEVLIHNKKGTIALAVLILQLCYLSPIIVMSYIKIYNTIFSQDVDTEIIVIYAISPLFSIVVNYIIAIAIILPIVNRVQKIKNKPMQS
ncbi:hypothetical protein ACLI1A_05155 [Flavobacterium sp. RHBU_3]|uniref:hypothetical protein n=1 Tax=Flavobacterium sp. RHBU_3 TaxID=3391184 RepID=UPI003984E9D6